MVEHHGERTVDSFRWGLVPFFARTVRDGARLINARAETVESSPAVNNGRNEGPELLAPLSRWSDGR